MADTDKLMISRAAAAKRLLEDPELTSAFTEVRSNILDRIEACPIRDTEGLHNLHLMLKLLTDVRANIQSVVNTGKVIEHRISMLERVKRKVKYG